MLGEVVGDSGSRPGQSLGEAVFVGDRAVPQYMTQVSMPSMHAPAITSRPRFQAGLKLSIIMAAYNEEQTIVEAIDEVLAVAFPCDVELIIVDDGSTDRTAELLAKIRDPRVVISTHASNSGKGAALLTGASLATGTHLIPFDADLEYVAADIVRMLEPVLRGRCSVVYGVRLFGYNTVYRSFWYAMGNKMLTRLTNMMYGSWLSDMHTCLKLIPISLMATLNLTESGFGLDTEITAALLRRGIRPFEVPVSYFSRIHAEGKKINWHDAVACLWILSRVRVGGAYSRKRAGLAAADDHIHIGFRTRTPALLGELEDDNAAQVTG